MNECIDKKLVRLVKEDDKLRNFFSAEQCFGLKLKFEKKKFQTG
jgi:hypothetical protein